MRIEPELRRKLRALQALAQRAATEAEAAAAAGRLHALLLRHRLTADDLDFDERSFAEDGEPLFASSRIPTWKWYLAFVIADANHVFLWVEELERLRQVRAVGGRPDVDALRYLFELVLCQLERLSRRACSGRPRGYGLSYRMGVVDAVKEKLRAATDTTHRDLRGSGDRRALVRLEAAVQRRIEAEAWATERYGLRRGRPRRYAEDPAARAHGYRDGRAVRLTTGEAELSAPEARASTPAQVSRGG